MPRYPYICTNKKCEHEFDDVQSIAAYKPKKKCPACRKSTLIRVLTTAAVGPIVGAGDTTGVVLNEDGSRYRLKSGTIPDQKKEIAQKLEQKHEAEVASGKYKRNIFEYNVD